MRVHLKKLYSFLMAITVTLAALNLAAEYGINASATTIGQVQENIDNLNQEIGNINDNISSMEDQQAILEEEMADLNAEVINTITSIGLKEDEITEKESEIVNKQSDIDATTVEYEAAKALEEERYADMVVRLRKMYEKGETDGLDLLMSGNGFSEMLNRMDNVESVYEYDRIKVEEYETAKNDALNLWNQLEEEKQDLEDTKASLEADKASLESQKAELDTLLAQLKEQSDNYEAQITKAKQEASVAKAKLQQEQKELERLKEEKRRQELLQQQQAQNKPGGGSSSSGSTGGTSTGGDAANGTYTSDYNSIIDAAEGSDLGKQVAKYACQFVGNPYVAGGTSLTNGADCSGFTYRVYADFGYSLPRTSSQQRSAGTEVSYSEAQPGDIICYSGHVGIYIGDGKIVHASTQKTGIKAGTNAQYRPILSVRRIV